MTVPAWFVLLAVGCVVVRAMFGLASICDGGADEVGVDGVAPPRDLDGTVGGDAFPREWLVAESRPFDQEAV